MMSLTLRLTLLFSLVSVCILAGLGLLIQRSVHSHFSAEDFAELDDKMNQVVALLAERPETLGTQDLARALDELVLNHSFLTLRIDSTSGETLYASGPLTFPFAPGQTLSPGKRYQAEWSRQETGYRGTAMQLPVDTSENSGLIVIGSIETTRHTLFMQAFATQLFAFMLMATLLSTLLGWLAVRKGLAPLRLIKARARAVTAERLDQRLPLASVPTEIADLVFELNRMLDRLEESFNRLNHFSSDIAHELRTPLSNLMTQTQVSLTQSRSQAEYSDILASNLEEFERLSRMISDMLFLAKAENGLQLPSTDRVDLEEEVAKLFEFYEALAEDRQVSLSQQGQGETCGDRLMLDRALGNLISNAVRHTQRGEQIRVEIDSSEDSVQVRVCNQGSPIAPDEQRYIFDRFYRCDPARSHGLSEGTGLGLPITRAIARAHGGDVSVCSSSEETCFTLLLPAYSPDSHPGLRRSD